MIVFSFNILPSKTNVMKSSSNRSSLHCWAAVGIGAAA